MRFALVTPRYGAEITHGAEHACRLLAEELADRHDVDVLTTCARDPVSWKNVCGEGADRVRGVLVRRFAATGGSSSAGLVEYLRRQHRNYDALAFFSYHAGTSVNGLRVAPDRSILFPGATIHPSLRLSLSQETMSAAAALGYGSPAERRLVHTYMRWRPRVEEVVGVGIGAVHESHYPRLYDAVGETESEADADDAPEAREVDVPPIHLAGRGVLFRRRHRLHGRFALYAGAIDSANGTEELIEYFAGYTADDPDTSLLVMGVKLMHLPREPWLRSAGVLPDRDRLAALESADVALAPDPDDFVAEHTLDAMAAGTAVIASGRNPAAVDHIRRSNGGLYYSNRQEFVEALRAIMTNDRLRAALGRNGRRYVQQHYRWDAVIGRFERLVGRLKGSGLRA